MKSIGLLAFTFLCSCSMLKLHDCPTADWEKLGVSNANQGHPPEYYETLEKACAKPPPAGSKEKFAAGYARAIPNYCTTKTFFYLGENGEWANAQVCPADIHTGLNQSNESGRDLHDLKNRRASLKLELSESDLDSSRREVLSAELDDVERKIGDKHSVRTE